MADAELIAHEKTWHFFTRLLKFGSITVAVVLIALDLLLIKKW